MKRLLSVFTLLLLVQFGSASACDCYQGSAREKLRRFDSVFVGTVSSVERLGVVNEAGEARIRVTFRVDKRWKGEGDSAILDTVHNRSGCFGFWFEQGERFLIYAHDGPWGGLDVWWCGGAIPDTEDAFDIELKYLLKKKHQQMPGEAASADAASD